MGRPGSGKGTQAKMLVEKLGYKYFATGETFRTLAKEDTPLGRKVHDTIANGKLMPHWFASHIVNTTILNLEEDEVIVFDGTNRTLPEAELFYDVMQWLGRPYKVLYLDVSEDTITERILNRAKDSGREDDTEETVRTRVHEYDENTEPALRFQEERGLVVRIDGERPVEEIHEEIVALVQNHE